MKNKLLLVFAFVAVTAIYSTTANAQGMAVNMTGAAAANSAVLDVTSTTKGVLISRMTAAQPPSGGSSGGVISILSPTCIGGNSFTIPDATTDSYCILDYNGCTPSSANGTTIAYVFPDASSLSAGTALHFSNARKAGGYAPPVTLSAAGGTIYLNTNVTITNTPTFYSNVLGFRAVTDGTNLYILL